MSLGKLNYALRALIDKGWVKAGNFSRNQNKLSYAYLLIPSDDEFRFDIKAQEVATRLVRALHEAGITRTQLSEKLGWRPSRVSKVLSGGADITLKTLCQICDAMGLEFDLILREPDRLKVGHDVT